MDTSSTKRSWRVRNVTELGRVLTRVRTTVGLSQEDMARRIGVYRPYLSKLEQGASTEQLNRIFAVLREAGYELIVTPKGGDHG